MYDCAWSPQHPALFAAVDGTGRLDLWNLNKDTEVASASVTVEGGAALNRVTWTQSGLHVAAGDDQGKVWVYDVGEQLAVPQPDEWNKFAHTLQVIIQTIIKQIKTYQGIRLSQGSYYYTCSLRVLSHIMDHFIILLFWIC